MPGGKIKCDNNELDRVVNLAVLPLTELELDRVVNLAVLPLTELNKLEYQTRFSLSWAITAWTEQTDLDPATTVEVVAH